MSIEHSRSAKNTMTKKRNVTFSAVGDLMLGDHPVVMGSGIGTMIEKWGPGFPLSKVKDHFRGRDIVFANLEFVLSRANFIPDRLESMEMRSLPEAIDCLTGAGVNTVSVANNHMLQHGSEAFNETIELLKKNGIMPVGLRSTNDEFHSQPVTIERNGMSVGFLGYSCRKEQHFREEPLYAVAEENGMISDITKLKEKTDWVILSLHWGNEFINRPSLDQIRLGRRLVDYGADLIIGHHPHVLQGIERYGDGIIAYSLGNCVSDMWQSRMRESMVFECTLSENRICNSGFIPVRINRDYQPEILSGIAGERLSEKLESWSEELTKGNLSHSKRKATRYQREVRFNTGMYRVQCYFYFLTHLWKYRSSIIRASFKRFLQRRLESLGLRFD